MATETPIHFYTHEHGTPRPATLFSGVVVAIFCWAAVFLFVGRGGSSSATSIGTYRADAASLVSFTRSSDPDPVRVAAHLTDEPEDPLASWSAGYFRVILVLNALDTNHDRNLSAAEIELAPSAMAKLDLDRDGQLSPEECGASFGDAPVRSGTAEELVATLMAFDRNRDGKLDRTELPERFRGIFRQAGTPDEAPLGAEEIRALAARFMDPDSIQRARLIFMKFHPVLATLDADRDGILSPQEIRNAPSALLKLDSNGDHRLSTSELIPDPVSRALGRLMTLDRDSDGVISPAERRNPYAENLHELLDRADLNRDGSVSEAEARAELKRRILTTR